MVNPGAFRGLRKEFLINEKPNYKQGVEGGFAADALANIQRRYFRRFPVDLPHNEEPSSVFLESINDDMPLPEPEEPDAELEPEEYAAAIEKFKERSKLVEFRKAQIKRWMAYQYSKDQDINAMESGAQNPYRILLLKLTGGTAQRPRQRSAANTWRKTQRVVIDAETRRVAKIKKTTPKGLTALRDQVARDMFKKLSKVEQEQWDTQAKEEHEEMMKKWKDDLVNPPSTAPADRQRCIQGLSSFIQPILDLICESTGWKCTLVAGGPEPAHEGRLNVISVHSGTTSGDIKVNFGRAERARYKAQIVPIFGSFLQNCYSPEECRARALPNDEGFECLASMNLDGEGVNFDSLGMAGLAAVPVDEGGPAAASVDEGRQAAAPVDEGGLAAAPVDEGGPSAAPVDEAGPLPHPPPPSSDSDSSSPSSPARSIAGSPPPSPARSTAGSPPPSPARSTAGSPPPSPARSNVGSSLPPACSTAGLPPPSHVSASGSTVGLPPPPSTPPSPPGPNVMSPPPAPMSGVQVPRELVEPPPSTAPNAASNTVTKPAKRRLPPNDEQGPARPVKRSCAGGGIDAGAPSAPSSGRKRGRRNEHDSVRGGGEVTKRARSDGAAITSVHGCASSTTSNSVASAQPAASTTTTTRETGAVSACATSVSAPGSTSTKSSASATTTAGGPGTPTEATPVLPSSEAPKWFVDALTMFQSEKLGNSWQELVRTWGAFEVTQGYHALAKLKATHRPAAVGQWINRARAPTWRPVIEDLSEYEKDFRNWWFHLQPEWRQSSEPGVVLKTVDGNLDALRRPGVNGLLSVLAALFYWGWALEERDVRDRSPWADAVDECRSVIVALSSAPAA